MLREKFEIVVSIELFTGGSPAFEFLKFSDFPQWQGNLSVGTFKGRSLNFFVDLD